MKNIKILLIVFPLISLHLFSQIDEQNNQEIFEPDGRSIEEIFEDYELRMNAEVEIRLKQFDQFKNPSVLFLAYANEVMQLNKELDKPEDEIADFKGRNGKVYRGGFDNYPTDPGDIENYKKFLESRKQAQHNRGVLLTFRRKIVSLMWEHLSRLPEDQSEQAEKMIRNLHR